jgi:heterodisulfide reductase subunit B2
MKFALQRCCTTPIFLRQYESSTDAVLKALGIELVDIREFNCCGYPLKNFNLMVSALSAARNLALAEKRGLPVMTICNCCYGNLMETNHIFRTKADLKQDLNSHLSREGLSYGGGIEVRHVVEILVKELGVEEIARKVTRPFKGIKIAIHYGCHILRPGKMLQAESSWSPTLLDGLVEATGAQSIPWKDKTECCGSPVLGVNEDLSMDITQGKIRNARSAGADFLCVACPFCQLQFDRVQRILASRRPEHEPLPSILFTQLLGLSLGVDEEALGLAQNELDLMGIKSFLA